MDARRFAVSGRFGLALLAAWPALVVGLSATGERLDVILAVATFGLLPALFGAVTWLKAGQRHRKVVAQKRLVALAALLCALSVPLTHWPLILTVRASMPELNAATEKYSPLSYTGCGTAMESLLKEFYRKKPLGRIGIWKRPMAWVEKEGLCVAPRPNGIVLRWDDESRNWRIAR